MYLILFTNKARKELYKLSKSDTENTLQKISNLKVPFPDNLDVKVISGVSGFYRLRVGKVRVLFEIDKTKKEIWIRKIGYRGGFYKF